MVRSCEDKTAVNDLKNLEGWLAKLFGRTPKIDKNSKQSLVKAWPLVSVVLAALLLWEALQLWHLGHKVSHIANLVSAIGPAYADHIAIHLNGFYWLSLVLAVLEAGLLLLAAPLLIKRQKFGWDLLFYTALLNLAYGIFSALNNYGGIFSLLLQAVLSAAILYALFQTRDAYLKVKR